MRRRGRGWRDGGGVEIVVVGQSIDTTPTLTRTTMGSLGSYSSPRRIRTTTGRSCSFGVGTSVDLGGAGTLGELGGPNVVSTTRLP